MTVADWACDYDDLISEGRLCESVAAGEVEELAGWKWEVVTGMRAFPILPGIVSLSSSSSST